MPHDTAWLSATNRAKLKQLRKVIGLQLKALGGTLHSVRELNSSSFWMAGTPGSHTEWKRAQGNPLDTRTSSQGAPSVLTSQASAAQSLEQLPRLAAGLGSILGPPSADTLPIPDAVLAVVCCIADLSRDHESATAA